MAGGFTLTITNTRTSSFGETLSSEQLEVVYLLRQAAQNIGSGLTSRNLVDRGGNVVGSYVWSAGSINVGR
jgi:hypothetical protein